MATSMLGTLALVGCGAGDVAGAESSASASAGDDTTGGSVESIFDWEIDLGDASVLVSPAGDIVLVETLPDDDVAFDAVDAKTGERTRLSLQSEMPAEYEVRTSGAVVLAGGDLLVVATRKQAGSGGTSETGVARVDLNQRTVEWFVPVEHDYRWIGGQSSPNYVAGSYAIPVPGAPAASFYQLVFDTGTGAVLVDESILGRRPVAVSDEVLASLSLGGDTLRRFLVDGTLETAPILESSIAWQDIVMDAERRVYLTGIGTDTKNVTYVPVLYRIADDGTTVGGTATGPPVDWDLGRPRPIGLASHPTGGGACCVTVMRPDMSPSPMTLTCIDEDGAVRLYEEYGTASAPWRVDILPDGALLVGTVIDGDPARRVLGRRAGPF